MTEDVEHNGRTITVHVDEVRSGRFEWWFVTPEGEMVRMQDRSLPSQAMVLAEGRHEAMLRLGA